MSALETNKIANTVAAIMRQLFWLRGSAVEVFESSKENFDDQYNDCKHFFVIRLEGERVAECCCYEGTHGTTYLLNGNVVSMIPVGFEKEWDLWVESITCQILGSRQLQKALCERAKKAF